MKAPLPDAACFVEMVLLLQRMGPALVEERVLEADAFAPKPRKDLGRIQQRVGQLHPQPQVKNVVGHLGVLRQLLASSGKDLRCLFSRSLHGGPAEVLVPEPGLILDAGTRQSRFIAGALLLQGEVAAETQVGRGHCWRLEALPALDPAALSLRPLRSFVAEEGGGQCLRPWHAASW